jgi:predicted enzyme related to lactoylglutathione lyase
MALLSTLYLRSSGAAVLLCEPAYPSTMQHVIDYVEFAVDDLEEAKAFYAKALGWTFNDYGPDYAGIQDPTRPGQEFGGLNPRPATSRGDGVVALARTDDADASLASVLGGGCNDVRRTPRPRRAAILAHRGDLSGRCGAHRFFPPETGDGRGLFRRQATSYFDSSRHLLEGEGDKRGLISTPNRPTPAPQGPSGRASADAGDPLAQEVDARSLDAGIRDAGRCEQQLQGSSSAV